MYSAVLRISVVLAALLAVACGDDGTATTDAATSGADASAVADASSNVDGLIAADAATADAAVVDAAMVDAPAVDATPPADAPLPDAMLPDAAVDLADHVHIYVSNTCVMTVSPTSFDVQPGQTLQLDWHNHSNDYAVDVWKSYGGGYLDLMPGATWNESYIHCSLSSSYTEYADISTACSNFRVYINCL